MAALAVLFFVSGRGRRERLTGENANIGTERPAEGKRGEDRERGKKGEE